MIPVKNEWMRPSESENIDIRALSRNEDLSAVYFHRKDTAEKRSVFEFELSPGSYSFNWTDTKNGEQTRDEIKDHPGGIAKITSPVFSEDLALRIVKSK
jgi:hypothetical protein